MASMKRDVQGLVELLVSLHGCEAHLSNNGHWRISRTGHRSITVSRSPSDRRVLKNIRRDCRLHLGVDLPPA